MASKTVSVFLHLNLVANYVILCNEIRQWCHLLETVSTRVVYDGSDSYLERMTSELAAAISTAHKVIYCILSYKLP